MGEIGEVLTHHLEERLRVHALCGGPVRSGLLERLHRRTDTVDSRNTGYEGEDCQKHRSPSVKLGLKYVHRTLRNV